jgi:hypothetical protein
MPSRGDADRHRVAEEEAQHVQVVDAHVQDGQPVVAAQKRLPVRNGTHLDGGQHGGAQRAPRHHLPEHAHRLVVAHILIDREQRAGRARLGGQPHRLRRVHRQRLLRQDAADMRLCQGGTDQRRLLVRREGDVENRHCRVGDEVRRRAMHPRDVPPLCRCRRPRDGARGDRHHRKAGLRIGRKLHVGHDEPGADAADWHVAAADRRVGHEAGCRIRVALRRPRGHMAGVVGVHLRMSSRCRV